MKNPTNLEELLSSLEQEPHRIARKIWGKYKQLLIILEPLNEEHQLLEYFKFAQDLENEAMLLKFKIQEKYSKLDLTIRETNEASNGDLIIPSFISIDDDEKDEKELFPKPI